MKKIKVLSCIVLTIIVLSISGCSKINSYQKSVYKDDSKIEAEGDSFTFQNKVGTIESSKTDNKADLKFGGFDGADTIWIIEAKENKKYTLEYDVKIEEGNFKIAFINSDGKVTSITEKTEKNSKEIDIPKGKSRIKIVGNSAKGQFVLSIKADDNITITKKDNSFK
ncbi:lipoprotein [Clostridium sp. YIM B02515]|uniref:Lipoprotein n=1 Tax=Clostridium rhizosphaerae TaxID=2803861 RepID=A0ABS1TDV9_9CLOT|nr:lipoprotein [Clostridium rhizosphaerae]MBL4936529.1 lipoprotein [Clostridium rhizosphaerae]